MDNRTEKLTIAKIVNLPRLRVYDTELATFEASNPFTPEHSIVDRNTYVGIEVEVENVQTFNQVSPYWTITEDGSLRNSGREFVSIPIKAYRAEQALNVLFKNTINKDVEFTERTSIHVHMNIRTLTIAQLEALVLTYMVFEKSLFSFAGEDRYNNIFCVPLVETDIGKHLNALIQRKHPHVKWQKYTSLNLLPIMEKGTVEFRHLGGTGDIARIITWINLILSLKKFALQKPPSYIWSRIESLNTTSEYKMFGDEVFGELIHLLWNDSFNTNVSECVSYIKLHCIENPFKQELSHKFLGIEKKPKAVFPYNPNDFPDETMDEPNPPSPFDAARTRFEDLGLRTTTSVRNNSQPTNTIIRNTSTRVEPPTRENTSELLNHILHRHEVVTQQPQDLSEISIAEANAIIRQRELDARAALRRPRTNTNTGRF